MNRNVENKELVETFALMIHNQQFDAAMLQNTSIQTFIDELNVNQQELLQQCNELAERNNELEAEKAKYQKHFEESPVSYVILDSNLITQEVNSTFARFCNVSQEELTGKLISALIHSDSIDDLTVALQECIKRGKSEPRIIKWRSEKGTVIANLICNRCQDAEH